MTVPFSHKNNSGDVWSELRGSSDYPLAAVTGGGRAPCDPQRPRRRLPRPHGRPRRPSRSRPGPRTRHSIQGSSRMVAG